MDNELLPLDRLMGQLVNACRWKNNQAFIKPFLETCLKMINEGKGFDASTNIQQQAQDDSPDAITREHPHASMLFDL